MNSYLELRKMEREYAELLFKQSQLLIKNHNMEKQILVNESLIQTTADMLDIASQALNRIATMPVESTDALKLQQIAKDAILSGDDSRTLNQQFLSADDEKES